MVAKKVADFFAQFSVRVDQRKINAFEKKLNKIEQKLLSIQNAKCSISQDSSNSCSLWNRETQSWV